MKALLRCLSEARCYFIILFDFFCILVPRQRSGKLKKQVLIIRLDGIGDFILWLDAAKELKSLYPHDKFEITLLSNKLWASLAEQLPYFDAVWSIDIHKFTRNLSYRRACMMKVREAGFDLVIQPTYSRNILHGDAIVRISGSDERLGSQGDCANMSLWQKRISDKWYTRLIPATNELLMELIRNAEFMRGLGLTHFRASVPQLSISAATPAGFNIKDYYILFPGAGVESKQWPVSYFGELAKLIYRATGWTGIICGGPEDKRLGAAIEKYHDISLQNWVGRTTLAELSAITAGAKILIGNDTSAIHIAAAVSTPSICIVGGWHYQRFVPYRVEGQTNRPLPVAVTKKMECFKCNWQCIHSTGKCKVAPCIANISVEDVWDKTKTLL